MATTDSRSLLEIAKAYAQPGLPVRAHIEGMTPGLLMHNGEAQTLSKKAEEDARAKGHRGKFIPTPEQEASWGQYRFAEGVNKGVLYLPAKNLKRSLVEAAKAFKMEKSRATMFKAVAAGVTVPPEVVPGFPLHMPGKNNDDVAIYEYEIHVERAVVRGSSIMRARPLIVEWACDVEFAIDPEAVHPAMFAQIFGYAGARTGVCDNRPEKGGEYGRFTVTSLEVVEDDYVPAPIAQVVVAAPKKRATRKKV